MSGPSDVVMTVHDASHGPPARSRQNSESPARTMGPSSARVK